MKKHIVSATLNFRSRASSDIFEEIVFDDFDEALRKAESLCRDILDSMSCRPYRDYSIEVYVYKDVPVVDSSVDRELAEDLPLAACDILDLDHLYSYSDEDLPAPTYWIWYNYDELGHDLPDMTWNIKPSAYPVADWSSFDDN